MDKGGLILTIASILSAAAAFIWLAYKQEKHQTASGTTKEHLSAVYDIAARQDVEHIFNDEFRQELRNKGRLYFERIINDNAMFLQQDLRQTTAQLNEYLRSEITNILKGEFKKYEQSINDAKQLALDSINKTITTIDQQREFLQKQMEEQSKVQKAELIRRFETEMAGIVNHYVLQAIGSQIDLSDQLDYILAEMESNKAAIIEDLQRGI